MSQVSRPGMLCRRIIICSLCILTACGKRSDANFGSNSICDDGYFEFQEPVALFGSSAKKLLLQSEFLSSVQISYEGDIGEPGVDYTLSGSTIVRLMGSSIYDFNEYKRIRNVGEGKRAIGRISALSS